MPSPKCVTSSPPTRRKGQDALLFFCTARDKSCNGVMKLSWIYYRIDSLPTPCGEISVVNAENKRCRFSIRENPYHPDYYLFYGTEKEQAFHAETNYLLCVHTDDLIVGQTYKVHLIGSSLHFGDRDEHTEAVSGTANGYSIAIGAYDPNDDEKIRQACEYSSIHGLKKVVPPPRYDESRFVQYDVKMLADHSGFSFRLLERSIQEIVFPVAWVENKYKGRCEYEDAVKLWVT